jgi:hypothetical protein
MPYHYAQAEASPSADEARKAKGADGTHLHHRFRRRARSGSRTTLLGGGHEVIAHARSAERLAAIDELIDQGASAVVGDLADHGA